MNSRAKHINLQRIYIFAAVNGDKTELQTYLSAF